MLQPKEFLCTSVTLHILYASGYKKRAHASFEALLYVVERRDQVRTCIKDPCHLALTLDSGGLLRGINGLGITLSQGVLVELGRMSGLFTDRLGERHKQGSCVEEPRREFAT